MSLQGAPSRLSEVGRIASGRAKQAALETAGCLRFYSRLPAPRLPWEPTLHALPDFRTMPRMLPIAGAAIGGVGAAVLLLGQALGLGPWVAAALGLVTLVAVTGALHEDGLADTADGFFGGVTPERRLEIMRDSRIGSFGAIAIALSLLLRALLLGTLGERLDAGSVAAAMVAVGALSRTAALLPMSLLDPTRSTGSSHAVGQPTRATLATAWVVAALIALVCVVATALPFAGVALAFVLAAAAALGLTRLSARLIGGQSGDVIGATQQLAEIAALLGLLIAARP
jgi:adenosylcobinamide-GDP ribazoletransferase